MGKKKSDRNKNGAPLGSSTQSTNLPSCLRKPRTSVSFVSESPSEKVKNLLKKNKKSQTQGPGFLFIYFSDSDQTFSLVSEAEKYSLFILAILVREIPFGHSASQAPVLVQAPNPSASIWATIFSTLVFRST